MLLLVFYYIKLNILVLNWLNRLTTTLTLQSCSGYKYNLLQMQYGMASIVILRLAILAFFNWIYIVQHLFY